MNAQHRRDRGRLLSVSLTPTLRGALGKQELRQAGHYLNIRHPKADRSPSQRTIPRTIRVKPRDPA